MLHDRFIKTFSGEECQRGSVLFSANPTQENAVKDARHAVQLCVDERLKLVVTVESSDDDNDDSDVDDDNQRHDDDDDLETMDEIDTGKLR